MVAIIEYPECRKVGSCGDSVLYYLGCGSKRGIYHEQAKEARESFTPEQCIVVLEWLGAIRDTPIGELCSEGFPPLMEYWNGVVHNLQQRQSGKPSRQ
jgi:hypothetical protein